MGVTTVGYDTAREIDRYLERRAAGRDPVEREVDDMFAHKDSGPGETQATLAAASDVERVSNPDRLFQGWLGEHTLDDTELTDEEPCRAATHGPRNSTCTCEDSRDE